MTRPRDFQPAEFIGPYPSGVLTLNTPKRMEWGWQHVRSGAPTDDHDRFMACVIWHLLTHYETCSFEHLWQVVADAYNLSVTTEHERVQHIATDFRDTWQKLTEILPQVDGDDTLPS